jgi:glycine/D-amino acid oxidase-like deaminating enzyme/nitrite reductase/ring-hydroxylating ferredoxin subunit
MQRHESLWLATAPVAERPTLSGDLTVDVAVIGGGIAGILAGWHLEQEGFSVAVLEANRICAGVTAYTTAKVTSAHTLIYDKLFNSVGQEHAQAYADANQWGIEWIARMGQEIDCALERKAMVVFAENDEEKSQVQKEYAVATKLGLPVAWTDSVDLPIKTLGGARYENQLQFHPRKFTLSISGRMKGQIFERTRVLEVEEGEICTVTTDRGKVRARFVVVASHYPVYDPAMYYARLAPYRDYAVAAEIDGKLPGEMSIGAGEQGKAFRTQGNLLVVSGGVHKVGQADTTKSYQDLEAYVREHFKVRSVPYTWSTQDNSTPDSMPYIGKISSGSKNVFVVTGFGAWGMSTSAFAGRIVADLAVGRENQWVETFKPARFKGIASAQTLISENVNVAKHLIGDKFTDKEDRHIESLATGEAAILELDGHKVAAFRDDSGQLHAVSPACTHMGCDVAWNSAEQSWDCPCHGSRFDPDGNVIQGPAINNLERKPVAAKRGPELI